MPRIKNSKKKMAGVLNAIRAREEVHGEETVLVLLFRVFNSRHDVHSALFLRALSRYFWMKFLWIEIK